MTVRSPYQVYARTAPFWGERPPRGYTRTDRAELNLFDAGHGEQSVTRNPVLLGLGVTLRLRLNVYVREWRVYVQEEGQPEVEITDQFQRVAPRMYELRGVAGAGAFNPENRLSADWSAVVPLKFRVWTKNVTLESNFHSTMYIQDSDDIRSCPDPCQDDFALLRMLRREHVRLWRDVIEPTRQPRDTATDKLIYLFEQAEHLKSLSLDICNCYNYYTLVMIGVKFFIVGTCEQSSLAEAPEEAGCNPWDGVTLPKDSAGNDIILPALWPTSGCP